MLSHNYFILRIYMYLFTCVCTCVCIHVHVHVHVCVCVCVCVCVYMCVYSARVPYMCTQATLATGEPTYSRMC